MQNYFCDIEVFADGMIDAWGLSDLTQFSARFGAGTLRVLTSIPDGESLSIHHLGTYKVCAAKWKHTPQSYMQQIEAILRAINPDLSNLYRVTKRELEENKRMQTSLGHSHSKPYRVTSEIGNFKEFGFKTKIFVLHKNCCSLATATAFKNGIIAISHSDFIEEITLAALEAGFQEGRFITSLETSREVLCGELGTLTLVNGSYCVDAASKFEEIRTAVEKLNDHDRSEICRQAYHYYLALPCDYTREKLREAYESVPQHLRVYLGDMDHRDTDYKRILYCTEKREV